MNKKNHPRTDYLLIAIGIISLSYFVVLLMNMSFTTFLLIYPILSSVCFIYAVVELKYKRSIFSMLPRLIRYLTMILLILFFSSFIAAEGLIIYQSLNSNEAKSDFVLVLGAQVNGDKVSASLKYRLDAAYEIYEKHPDSIFIVSGGQGEGENDSEAYYMENYLINKGIPEQQIICENQSLNTYENIKFSKQIMDDFSDDNYDVIIVSNAFHTFRAKFLAQQQGLDVTTYSAKMHTISIPNFYLREYFALMKDLVVNFRG